MTPSAEGRFRAPIWQEAPHLAVRQCGTIPIGCENFRSNSGSLSLPIIIEGRMKEPLNGASDDLLRRVRGEFIEMPGLRLTSSQAQRLWGLAREDCERVLQALVNLKFLISGTDEKVRQVY